MEEFRVSKSRDEIVKIIKQKFESENLMTIWQKDHKTGERVFKCEVQFHSLNHLDGHFSVVIGEESKKNFRHDLETYFLLKFQDFVFKTKLATTQPKNGNSINFQIPYDVKLKELRIHPRVYLKTETKRYVSVTFASREQGPKSFSVTCPIYSISKTGICIIISKETLSSIKLNQEIELEGLSFFDSLTNEKKAIVRNARVYSKKDLSSDEFYALGLEFQS
jgi:hypothetical protein